MKAVLIAESEDTINEYSSFLEEAGVDVITYRWFLKALDNLTEIQPHMIIVSAQDFPRHWKTIFTHLEAGEVTTQPLVYLIGAPDFPEEEKKKAMFLGAHDIFQSPMTDRDKNSLLSILPAGMAVEAPVPQHETAPLPEPVAEETSSATDDQITKEEPSVEEQEEEAVGEYAAFKAAAEAEEAVVEAEQAAADAEEAVSAAKAEAEADEFNKVDSELSDFNPHDEAAMEEFMENGITEQDNSLVVEGADEDILTKLEDEMTIKEIPDDLKEEAVVEEEPAVEEETVVEEKRPEQVTWSAPIDEIEEESAEEPIQFSFINPKSGLVVNGTVQNYNHPTLKFVPENDEVMEGVRFGQILEQCKFTFEGETIKTRAQVRGLGQTVEFCLLY